MYIQLTNAHPDFMDKPIIINTANIVAVYEEEVASKLTVTCVHCPPHGTWNVRETIQEVSAALSATAVSAVINIKDTAKPKIDLIEVAASEKRTVKKK